MLERLKIALHLLLPKHYLSRLAGWLADYQGGLLTRALIYIFVRYYRVDLQEAQQSKIAGYKTFNAFFTRQLLPQARPLVKDTHWLVLPVDGTVSQIGSIADDSLLQAKEHYYHLPALLAGDEQLVEHFRGGFFATFYLSPRDYHRVHMPCDGLLRQMIYVPGDLFSVNALTTRHVPSLFTRNERIITIFETQCGPMAQILVGATIVGSINVVWAGTVTSPNREVACWHYPTHGAGMIKLQRGAEMGHFKLGSTVINLFAPNSVLFAKHLGCCMPVRLGEPYARQDF